MVTIPVWAGAIVDSRKSPWAKHKDRFKRLNEPDVSYHGAVYTETMGEAAYIGRARVVPLRNTGAALSPFNSFLILQGIETLALRLDRVTANTFTVAQHLKKHPKVNWVNYAGLEDHPDHALAKKYFKGKASGVIEDTVHLSIGIEHIDDLIRCSARSDPRCCCCGMRSVMDAFRNVPCCQAACFCAARLTRSATSARVRGNNSRP